MNQPRFLSDNMRFVDLANKAGRPKINGAVRQADVSVVCTGGARILPVATAGYGQVTPAAPSARRYSATCACAQTMNRPAERCALPDGVLDIQPRASLYQKPHHRLVAR